MNFINDNLMKLAESYMQDENAALKHIFSGKIKQNFLIKIKSIICDNSSYSEILINNYRFLGTSMEKIMTGYENRAIDICKFITMNHYFNTLTIDNEQLKAAFHTNKEYEDILINQVINAIKIRDIALQYNSKSSLEGYYPITYSLYALNNYMGDVVLDRMKKGINPKGKNGEFKAQMQLKMLHKIKAILVLIDNTLIEESFNSLRSLAELFMIYRALFNSSNRAIEKYNQFVKYQFDYINDKVIAEEVINRVDELNSEGYKVSKTDYLNFGWLDSILEYGYINKYEKKYRIADVAKLLDMMYRKEMDNLGSTFYTIYRECSLFSHGFNGFLDSYNAKQTVLNRLGILVLNLGKDFIEQYEVDFEHNGIHLLQYFNTLYSMQLEYDKKISKNPKLLKKLNDEYIDLISF